LVKILDINLVGVVQRLDRVEQRLARCRDFAKNEQTFGRKRRENWIVIRFRRVNKAWKNFWQKLD
jgi:hypothetical protein